MCQRSRLVSSLMVFEIASWDEEACTVCRRAAAMMSRGGAGFFTKVEREIANNDEQTS
jgi:hypothetical protein